MGTFDSANNTLRLSQIFKGLHSFFICNRHILCSANLMKIRMFRADSGIIQSCRNRIYFFNISVIILAEKGFHTMKYTDTSLRNCCRMVWRINPFPSGFTSDELYIGIIFIGIKGADRITASAHTSKYSIRKTTFFFQYLSF